jgi:hypothetical protein
VPSDTHLLLVLPYPAGTAFVIEALPNSWCARWCGCKTTFRQVGSADAVRAGGGDLYHFDGRFLYVRVVQTPNTFEGVDGFDECDGARTWQVPDLQHEALTHGGASIQSTTVFETITITANCAPASNGSLYCAHQPLGASQPAEGTGGGGGADLESAVPAAAICPPFTELNGSYDTCSEADGGEGWSSEEPAGTTQVAVDPSTVGPDSTEGCNFQCKAGLRGKRPLVASGAEPPPPAPTAAPTAAPTPAPTPAPTTAKAQSLSCGAMWDQCAGENWEGSTCCESGSKCEFINMWYSQCK